MRLPCVLPQEFRRTAVILQVLVGSRRRSLVFRFLPICFFLCVASCFARKTEHGWAPDVVDRTGGPPVSCGVPGVCARVCRWGRRCSAWIRVCIHCRFPQVLYLCLIVTRELRRCAARGVLYCSDFWLTAVSEASRVVCNEWPDRHAVVVEGSSVW